MGSAGVQTAKAFRSLRIKHKRINFSQQLQRWASSWFVPFKDHDAGNTSISPSPPMTVPFTPPPLGWTGPRWLTRTVLAPRNFSRCRLEPPTLACAEQPKGSVPVLWTFFSCNLSIAVVLLLPSNFHKLKLRAAHSNKSATILPKVNCQAAPPSSTGRRRFLSGHKEAQSLWGNANCNIADSQNHHHVATGATADSNQGHQTPEEPSPKKEDVGFVLAPKKCFKRVCVERILLVGRKSAKAPTQEKPKT